MANFDPAAYVETIRRDRPDGVQFLPPENYLLLARHVAEKYRDPTTDLTNAPVLRLFGVAIQQAE